jgi:hypothetical protein
LDFFERLFLLIGILHGQFCPYLADPRPYNARLQSPICRLKCMAPFAVKNTIFSNEGRFPSTRRDLDDILAVLLATILTVLLYWHRSKDLTGRKLNL